MAVTKLDYNTDDWNAIVALPVEVSMIISLASPAMGDMFKESMALATTVAKTAEDPGVTGLLADVVAEYKDRETLKKAQPYLDKSSVEAAKDKLLESVREKVAMLDTTAGAQAMPYKEWLYRVAVATAEAAKEGDFMGIGGVRVNDAEKAALAELAAILQVSA